MFGSIKELLDYCRNEEVRIVNFKVADLEGRWHQLSIPVSRLKEGLWERGIGFDGSSYGFASVEASDMVFIPDISTAFVDPFLEPKTLSMIADVHTIGSTLERFEGDPRFIAQKAERFLASTGIADTAWMGPEFEFHLFDAMDYGVTPSSTWVQLTMEEAGWVEPEYRGSRYPVRRQRGYHAALPQDSSHNLRSAMTLILEDLGCPIKYHHHEVGRGQVEVEVEGGPLATMADRSLLIKYIIKNLAQTHGSIATFMPKPVLGEAGNGMHVHINLFKDGRPVFSDDKGYAGLSSTALSFIGGVLRHSPSLLALTNPSTNSYKRLVPGYEAPVSICFGLANRTSVVRIPGYARRPETRRFEYRPSDATANPYLALAALLMAGIDGVRQGINPSKEGFGPLDVNVFDLPPSERVKIGSLPTSLEESLKALEEDHQYLLEGGVFTSELLGTWISQRRAEARKVSETPHPVEFQLYGDL